MKFALVALVALAALAVGAAAAPRRAGGGVSAAHNALPMLRLRQRRLELIEALAPAAQEPPEQWFTQRLDHYNLLDRRTYQQRYFMNDEHYDAARGGPLFLQVGGEGAISSAYVTRLMMNEYAKRYGALQAALEHRFYGKTHPVERMAVTQLRLLSSEQALADAVAFVAALRVRYPNVGPVIAFGGSYPGALAAWTRVRYPTVFAAAVASSAPTLAVTDMVSYLEVVERSLRHIGGVPCHNAVSAAFASVDADLARGDDGRAALARDFGTCRPISADPADVATFKSAVIGGFMGVVQYNAERRGAPTVTSVCKMMTDSDAPSPRAALVAVTRLLNGDGCLDVAYADAVAQLKNETAWGDDGVGDRQWVWQTCQEFGFFQTTDAPDQPFGTHVPLSYYTQLCTDAYGLVAGPFVNETNARYGGNTPTGVSNIVFVNGNVDPWSSLSVLPPVAPPLASILINGTAHCANMAPAQPSDPPGLARAQAEISERLGVFVKGAAAAAAAPQL